ncbi:hypothetical protein DFP72DRAFT_938061 [Ephemerocybe angulata]|uniref:Uncharacterized protein n=1 Tax=Ephemerocybe angulata TaxID=980116 RepID=A0A8H6H8H9_9AGAR|nr:hypothetical protein DFP72DRAFT_938061 [Tulosesus angulatus]
MDDFEEKPKAGPPSFFQNASHFQVGNMEIKQVEGDYHDYSSKNIRNTYSSGNNYYNNYKDSFNQTQTTYNGAVQNGGTYTAGPTYNVEKVENGNFGDNYGTMYQNPVDAVKQLAQRQRNDPGYSGGYGGYGGGGGFGGGPRGPQPYPSPPPDPQYGANRSQPMGAAPYDGSPSQPKYGPYGSVNAPPSGGPPSQPQYGSYGSANSPPLGGSPPPPRPQYGAYGSANSPPLSGSPPRPQYGRYGSANSPPLGGSTPHNNGPPSNSPYGANRSPPMGGSALFGGAPPQAPQHGTAESPPPPQGGPVPFKGPKKATNPFYSNGATGYTSNGSTEQQSRHQPQHPPAQAPANSYGLARRNPFLPAQPQQPQQQRPGPQPIYDQFTESDPDLPRPHGKAEGAPSPPPANLTVPPVLSHTSSAPGRVQPFESWKEHESHGAEPPAAYPPPGHPHVPEAPVSAAPVIAVAGPLTQSPESVKWAKQTKETAEKARETEPEKEKEAWPGEARYKKKMQEAKLMMERADSVMSTTTTTTTSMTSDNSDSDMDSLDDDGYGIGTGRAAKEAEAKKEKKRVQDPARGWSQYSILNEPKTDAATGPLRYPGYGYTGKRYGMAAAIAAANRTATAAAGKAAGFARA